MITLIETTDPTSKKRQQRSKVTYLIRDESKNVIITDFCLTFFSILSISISTLIHLEPIRVVVVEKQ